MPVGAGAVSVELADSKEELQMSTPSSVLGAGTSHLLRPPPQLGCRRQRVLEPRNEVEAQCCRGEASTRAVS